ncbi:16S rRNA G1207 methylase RsmC [Arthrobacter sp. CAN_A212]|uniref:class I SAM-dependent methyltransferase n=1 Tax=unclassified Arthrobacter TaxID=235627 RepID=UPI0018CAD7C8|nr:methyltransferase [Arthrobacter sp. CAN_C5]MBP2217519.1 16S rRNA G1207 methylase RsmC [Arthrobacter sp. CAN_C5]
MDSHYFSAQPSGPEIRKPLRTVLAGVERTLVTSSGIFSADGLDKGTRILLAEAPDPEGTRMLDIGCGWGPLALTLALKAPDAEVVAVDVNERALALTAENAKLLGLRNVVAQRPEEVDAGATFDTIWSNPPIRVGKDELHALLLKWLPRLSTGGSAFLVVQKNLGADSLQKWLGDQLGVGYEVSRTASSKSFRIIQVERLSS